MQLRVFGYAPGMRHLWCWLRRGGVGLCVRAAIPSNRSGLSRGQDHTTSPCASTRIRVRCAIRVHPASHRQRS